MQHKRLRFNLVLLLMLGLASANAQESINSAGGNTLNSGGTVSYSLGQVVNQTYKGTGGSVVEGIQQPYEISVVTALEEAKGINLLVSVHPNPTTDFFTLCINEFEYSNLSYQIYDIQGKMLQSAKITHKQTSIVVSNLEPATYFVRITHGNKEIKTFKIIKK